MHLGLTSLFGSILNWKKLTPKKARPARRGRRLLGEQLETRYALAVDLVMPEVLLPAGDLTPVAAEESPPLADPSPGPGNPPGLNAAPVITGFTFGYQGSWLTIQGLVTDDQDPTGYTVQITGMMTIQLTVTANDWFSYTFQPPPGFEGTIFAQTQDMYGLVSNIASVLV